MHHYKRHIGDWRSATMHLSDLEELAYSRMVDVYYDTEQPLPADVEWIARRVRMDASIVQRVLDDFFRLDGDVWRKSRCDEELAEYRKAVRLARNNGKKGGRPRNRTGTREEPTRLSTGTDPGGESKAPQPPTPNPQPPFPNPQYPSTQSPQNGGGVASHESGGGERGSDPREREAIFALLGGTTLRSNSKNRRQILDEIAGVVWADGMSADIARRLFAKAKAETKGDFSALIGIWFKPGAWQPKWAEIVGGKVAGTVAQLAAVRRA